MFLMGYKTYIASALIAVAGVIQTVQAPTNSAGWQALGIAVIMAVLRSVTTTPPGAASK